MKRLRLSGSARPGDVLGRHGRAADDEEVDPGIHDGLPQLLGALRGEGAGDGDAGGADLAQPLGDEVGLDLLAVDLLHAGGRQHRVEGGDLGEQRGGVLVAGPQALEVEHRQAAELAERDGGLRATSPSPSGRRSPGCRSGRRRSASRPTPPRGRACGATARWRCRRRNRPGGRACHGRSRSRSPGHPIDGRTSRRQEHSAGSGPYRILTARSAPDVAKPVAKRFRRAGIPRSARCPLVAETVSKGGLR